MNIKELWGSWDLISFSHTLLETKIKTNIMGDNPNGTIIFTEDNCVSVIITNESRKTSNDIEDTNYLYNSMMAYMGRYSSMETNVTFILKFHGIHLGLV
ncbi:lipocalin-like domain-containing protein [Photobacterium kishitanii]|uniref:lipocalin-like domain-containing protein n=1 Tax=Photobacterium kishitanii TaxID=318456 RepID=UPI0005D4348F|nr:lipocalin-like domain-containing protein [Photobacterium kishitanii]KJG71360.1 hypothetical protein UA41_01835 [Photobacterium kishitanii]